MVRKNSTGGQGHGGQHCPITELLNKEVQASESNKLIEVLTTAYRGPHHALVIRPIKDEIEYSDVYVNGRYQAEPRLITPLDAEGLVENQSERDRLLLFADRAVKNGKIVFLNNIESVAFIRSRRLILLAFLESTLYRDDPPSIVILCDVSPLYMLTRQSEYLSSDLRAEFADAQEVVRWSRLLSKFEKYYDWSPRLFHFTDDIAWKKHLLREITIWPKLYSLAAVFKTIVGNPARNLSEEQIVQFVGAHAGAEYRRRWSLCTQAERLILYQLANGLMVNVRNIEPLEHLMRRGYIVRNPRWSIANKSFARFVRTAESDVTYSDWMDDSQRGLWQLVKVPLIGFAFAAIGIIIYSTQDGIDSVLAIATGLLTLIPLLLKSVSLVKAGGEAQPEN
ncbi:Uncharacterised protein [Halioglobus japonicus]|nr:Uncharacterised protein [Halioglobus japonicus]